MEKEGLAMDSRLRTLLHMDLQPVAVLRAEVPPDRAAAFPPGTVGRCMVPQILAAARGETVAFPPETVGCNGARAGLGFSPAPPGTVAHLACAAGGLAIKRTPELADAHLAALPEVRPSPCLVLKPLDRVGPEDEPVCVILLADADQLSALVGLAGFDRADPDGVRIPFGSGCAQAIRYPLADSDAGRGRCTVGLTDISARLRLEEPTLLSFSLPYRRFLELEALAEESFLTRPQWRHIAKRYDGTAAERVRSRPFDSEVPHGS